MSISIKTRIKNKIDTVENWNSTQLSSYVLLSGEIAFEKNTSDNTVNFKVGDGQQQYLDLPYAIPLSVSQLENDNGYISAVPDTYKTYDTILSSLSANGYALKQWVEDQLGDIESALDIINNGGV